MKTLILTCNTGQGHNSSAAAIQEVFVSNGHECNIADTLSFLSKGASKIVDTCFTAIYRHIPKAFNLGYTHTDVHIGKLGAADTLLKVLIPGSKRLQRYIVENGYTHVICVHIFSAIMLTMLREQFGTAVSVSFLTTDYTYYPLMEKVDVDLYLLPHADLKDQFCQSGIAPEKLVPTGMPVRRAFLTPQNKQEARKALGLSDQERIIFMMGGSMGCGPIEELVRTLSSASDDNTRILIACGTNTKLLRNLQKLASNNIHPFRYADNIHQIMSAADLFITKPGGISITEAATLGLPILLLDFVGGCETQNYRFFTEHQYAFGCENIADAVTKCHDLLQNPDILAWHSAHLRDSFNRDPANEIYRAIAAQTTP